MCLKSTKPMHLVCTSWARHTTDTTWAIYGNNKLVNHNNKHKRLEEQQTEAA